MFTGCKNGYKHDSDNYCEKNIYEVVDKPFSICANFLQNAQRFTAALVFKFLVRQFHSMLQSIGKHLSAKFLYDHIQEVVLEVFSDSAHHGYANGCSEQHQYWFCEIP